MRHTLNCFFYSSRHKPDWILIAALAFAASIQALTDLSGSIGNKVFSASGNPYIVNENIIVPPGESVTINEGCRFFFRLYTGLTVDGNLEVKGTTAQPVIFTTINDTLNPIKTGQAPDPFDWTGITISEKAGSVRMSHFRISYSVQGIKSLTDAIVIDGGIFSHKGQYDFTLKGVVKKVKEGEPFSYGNFMVRYDANGAASGTVPQDTGRYENGDTASLASNTGLLARPGFAFDGWNSSPDGIGIDYPCGSRVIIGGYDVTLYAKWKPEKAKPRVAAFLRKNQVPLLLGLAAISAGGSALLYNQWKENGKGYENQTSIPRQKEIDGRGHLLSGGAIATGIVSAAALSAGVWLFAGNNPHGAKRAAKGMAIMMLPAMDGVAASLSIPIKSPNKKGQQS